MGLFFLSLLTLLIVAFVFQSYQQYSMSRTYSEVALADIAVSNQVSEIISSIQERMENQSQKISSVTGSRDGIIPSSWRPLKDLYYFPHRLDPADLRWGVSDESGLTFERGSSDQNIPKSLPLYSSKFTKLQNWTEGGEEKGHQVSFADRYACAIYDQGGLLDVNALGTLNPSSVVSGEKGGLFAFQETEASASIGLTGRIMKMIARQRHQYETMSPEKYLKDIGFKYGFMATSRESSSFLTRRELLQFLKENDIDENVAKSLTHFSRDYNIPSWFPTENQSANSNFKYSSEFQFKYADEANEKFSSDKRTSNRDFSNLRASDGSFLMRRRFPLSRLAVFDQGENKKTASTEEIKAWFGLTSQKDGSWQYDHGGRDKEGNVKIFQLHDPEFLEQKREPDFFELLQAGILYGSTGLTPNSSDLRTPKETASLSADVMDITTPAHILQIGLNIIDQWDSNSIPTTLKIEGRKYIRPLKVGATTVYENKKENFLYGQEAIPFLASVNNALYRPPAGVMDNNPNQDGVHWWLVPKIWNPYRTKNSPQWPKFKIEAVKGQLRLASVQTLYNPYTRHSNWNNSADFSTTPSSIEFDPNGNPSLYQIPHFLPFPDNYVLSDAKNKFNDGGSFQGVGIYVTGVSAPTGPLTSAPTYSGSFFSDILNGTQWCGPTPDWTKVTPFLRKSGGLELRLTMGRSTNTTLSRVIDGTSDSFVLTYSIQDPNTGQWKELDSIEACGQKQTNIEHSVANSGPHGIAAYTPASNSTPLDLITDVNNNTLGASCTASVTPLANVNGGALQVNRGLARFDPRTKRFGWSSPLNPMSIDRHPSMEMSNSSADWYISDKRTSLTFNNFVPTGFAFNPVITNQDRATSNNGGDVPGNLRLIADYADNRDRVRKVTLGNITSNRHFYNDLDGVVRPGDGDSYNNAYPNSQDPAYDLCRPVMLNRPFQSVAEMGYAYRDLPWKTLDFRSSESGDAALLDLFSLEEEPEVTGGKVNINSASKEILSGIIEGVYSDPILAEPQKDIFEFISSMKKSDFVLKSRADLVKAVDRFYPITTNLDHAIKHRREGLVRGLVDSVQTRTWNLMIDLHSELGQEKEDNPFATQLHRHHWIHLAIDRFSGKVIDIQLEEVF